MEDVRTVDPLGVMEKSLRFDLIFKVELARAWGEGDSRAIHRAEEAYLEMVRARNGFYERMPPRRTPADFIDGFRAVASSVRQRGYDPQADPIPLDVNGEVVNGAHRLSACIAYGRKCPVCTSDRLSSGGSRYEAFVAGNIHPAVAHWGMSAYRRLLPEGPLASGFSTADADEPFPDWSVRAKAMRSFQVFARFKLLRYRLASIWRKGHRQEKAISHAEEIRCRLKAYQALADYWAERERRTGGACK